jgi:hypothetical protein
MNKRTEELQKEQVRMWKSVARLVTAYQEGSLILE